MSSISAENIVETQAVEKNLENESNVLSEDSKRDSATQSFENSAHELTATQGLLEEVELPAGSPVDAGKRRKVEDGENWSQRKKTLFDWYETTMHFFF